MQETTFLESLLKEKADIDARIWQIRAEERAKTIEDIRTLMEQHGLTVRDLGGAKKTRKLGSVAAKYRDPASGATWSGRGRRPKWMHGIESDNFLIAA
jgi:DNA-binding protein H-NS